jgi:hypothetical protein
LLVAVSERFLSEATKTSPQKKATTSRFACDERTRRGAARREATWRATAEYGEEAVLAREAERQLRDV